MFCPNCGKNVDQKLKFCNGCGERLAKATDDLDSPGKMLDGILETIFWLVVASLGILIGLVAVLLSNNVKPDAVGLIILAYLATIFGISFSLARQVPKLIDAKLRRWNAESDSTRVSQLPPPTTAQLEEYREPAMSVTDHTTKTLDPVPVDRN